MRVPAIIRKDLLLLLRDRGQLISLFALPLAFIIPISLALGGIGYVRSPDSKRPLPVANYDRVEGAAGARAQSYLDALAESFGLEAQPDAARLDELGLAGSAACAAPGPACDEAAARALVERGERDVAVIVPANLSAAVDAGERVTVTLLYDPVGDAIEREFYQGVIEAAALKLSIENQVFTGFDQFQDMVAVATEEVRREVEQKIAEQEAQAEANDGASAQEVQPAIGVEKVVPASYTAEAVPNAYQQTVPGYTVMFVFFLISYVAASMRLEKGSGALRRQLFTPARRATLLGGKLAAAVIVGVAQVAIMFAVAHFGFGMELGRDPVALALLTVMLAATATALGLLAATLRSDRGLSIVLIVAALLGGCMFPASWLPQFLRALSYAIPHTYAMQGFQDVLVRGQGLAAVWPELLALLGFTALAFFVAVRRFDFGSAT